MGKRLGPTSSRDDIADFTLEELTEGQRRLRFNQRLSFGRKAVRCLFKIALESIAFYEGVERARDPIFDPIRRFVRDDLGDFKALLLPGGPFNNYMGRRYAKEGCHSMVPFTIFELGFVCDFDPEFKGGKNMQAVGLVSGEVATVLPNCL